MFGSLLPSGQFVIYSAYVLIGLATFLVSKMLFQEQDARAAQDAIDDATTKKPSNLFVGLTRPFYSRYLVPVIRGKKFWDDKRKAYRRKLVSSGLREELSPDDLIAFKFTLIAFFPIILGFMKAGGLVDLNLLIVLSSAPIGWFYPDFWVNSRVNQRHSKIRRSMPFVVDLLALSTEAGMDFVGAIGKVVEKASPGPLIDELTQVLREIKVGSSRADALRELSIRVGMTEVNSFVAVIISADQMGAPVGKVLKQQSEQIRNSRFITAEKAGAQATTRLIFPTIFIVLPAVMLMIFGPFILSMFRPGG